MSEFDYDINNYMDYRKSMRVSDDDKKYFIMEIQRQEKQIKGLQNEVKELKSENRQLKAQNEVGQNIINSYEKELSEGAKKFVKDIAARIDCEEVQNYKKCN